MAYSTFTWNPDLPARRRMKPNVHPIKFGDGHENRIADGINFMLAVWTVKFTADVTTVESIRSFLETQAGLTPFTWTDPLNNTATYICRQWDSDQMGFGVYELNATFEQVLG